MFHRRPAIALAATLLSLAVPAAANADFMAKRLPKASIGASAKRPARAHSTQDCANADLAPTAGNLAAIRAAVLCLHNQVRSSRGLSTLGTDSKLRRTAAGHSADMVDRSYFEHTTPDGVTMVDRIMRSGYVRPDRGWMIGENLEWGTGQLATPRGAMQAWMDSADHRANILRRGYAELGVGVSLGTPTPGNPSGATYTVDFGTIR